MGKVTSKALFKAYDQQQVLLLPPSLEEMIPEHHLVRVVDRVVENLDLSDIINEYQGGGTTAYHPRMLAKVLLYAYSVKLYTGRRIAKALRQDINFMWLAAYNKPDFRTINLFRSGVLKDTIEQLFQQMLIFLVEHGYVRAEDYFTDGTTIAADANKYKVVWRKNAVRFKHLAEQKCLELFKQIDALNDREDLRYGDNDLEEVGSQQVDKQSIEDHVKKLENVITRTKEKRVARKAAMLKRKVEEQHNKIDQYEQQLSISDSRTGYSKTDHDATAMRLKNDELVPAYNILASSEGQFITAYSLHQNSNDARCFKEHLQNLPIKPATITGDSIFGTEQNYQLLEGAQIDNYLKFQSFHQEQTRKYRDNRFLRENFPYQQQTDTYICPDGRQLKYRGLRENTNEKTGFTSTYEVYQPDNCSGCVLKKNCIKSGEGKRTLTINRQLDHYKQQARQNLSSEKGWALRRRRGMEIESCFGDIKHNMGFRRFHLRGKTKVNAEFGLLAIAHNIRKVQINLSKN